MGRFGGSRIVAGPASKGWQFADLFGAGISHRNWPALRRWLDVGAAHPYFDHGILALVGCAPLGCGIFEVFATAIISLLFVRMGILRTSTATVKVLFATIIFLFGGVLRTFHHLYFSGTPTSVIAVGAMISALEVVPLLVVGFKAYNRHKVEHEEDWERNYHWPFMFFAAVLF